MACSTVTLLLLLLCHSSLTLTIRFHIDKWNEAKSILVRETPSMYQSATSRYVASIPPHKNDWIENIFEGKKEVDRVLHLNNNPETGFVLVQDFKMDATIPTSVYLQCIFRDRRLCSIRDLRASHIEMLCDARNTIFAIASEKLHCKQNELRLYFHYYPVRSVLFCGLQSYSLL
jgi:m7GpppX diphosphatase